MCYTYGMENFNINDFWNRIKYLCKVNYTTIQDFSIKIGLGPKAVQNQRTHNVNPNLKQLIDMADYFECSLDYLITGVEYTPKSDTKDKEAKLAENLKKHIDIKNFRLEKSLESRRESKSENENSALRSKLEEIKKLSEISQETSS